MDLNWTSFILEVVNFLVLVWILKRFLYKPVLGIIARRREGIEKAMSEAQDLKRQAQASQAQYENRLSEWETEKQQAREALTREIEDERQRRMADLQGTLQAERDKAAEADQRRLDEAQRKAEETALGQAAGFASRLLQGVSCPELEARLLDLLLQQLPELDPAQVMRLRQSGADDVVIGSAFELDENQRQALEDRLATVLGKRLPLRYSRQEELVAGVRITIGAWVLGANLADELKGFAELARGAE